MDRERSRGGEKTRGRQLEKNNLAELWKAAQIGVLLTFSGYMLSPCIKLQQWAGLRERERHVEWQARDWLNHRELRSKDEQSEIAGVSKLNRWCTPVIHYMNRQHAASQADRQSSFRDAGYEELQLKRETEERPGLRSLLCQLCSSVTCGLLTCQVYTHYLILEEHEVMKTSNDRCILNTNQPVTLTWRRSCRLTNAKPMLNDYKLHNLLFPNNWADVEYYGFLGNHYRTATLLACDTITCSLPEHFFVTEMPKVTWSMYAFQ